MGRINLDELAADAETAMARFETGNPAELVVLRHLRAVARYARELEIALAEAMVEIQMHSEEYQHITPQLFRDDWAALLKEGPLV